MRTLCVSLLPFIAIYLQFGQFSASSFSLGSGQKNQMKSIDSVFVAQSASDFDTSQWATILFCSLAAMMYLVIIAEVAIVQTYLQLCEEDYKWQWPSLLYGVVPAFMLFILALMLRVFFGRSTQSSVIAQLLSMILVCGTVALIGASVAFVASFKFN